MEHQAHSATRIHYDSDSDSDNEHEHINPELAPLISASQEQRRTSRSNSSDQQQDHHNHHLHDIPLQKPTTWIEWTRNNGIHPITWTRQTYLKAILLLVLITLIILVFTVLRVQDHIKDILRYIDDHRSVGAVLFVTFYTIACWLFLPGSLFTIGAGFLFRPMPFALAIVVLGDLLGALGSFLFGRYIFYDWVKSMMEKHPKFNALDQVIKDDGWKIVVMLRLTPIPFNLVTYFFSITSIALHTLLWATALGIFPGSCLGIWVGSLLKELSGIDDPDLETKNVVILVMNGIFIACSILALSIFGKRSMRNAMAKLDRHQDHAEEPDLEAQGILQENRDSNNTEVVDQIQRNVDLETSNPGLEPTIAAKTNARTTTASNSTTGFTRGEKITFVCIAIVVLVNICICIPLYFHFAEQDGLD
ncbi:hypothetical protein BGZ51_009765 [Haplosporangium sp. Z 767]|nr:hypothetical protein BGZ51_009765 [Haplosporangium sp. Z 767]KAF9193492.1 hypothetical protein BGZ50_007422 [Haplosporangium sp. Z 11]